MKCIKEIRIGFENCEEIVLPIEVIGYFSIEDIKSTVQRIGNTINTYNITSEVVMEIFPKANSLGNKGLFGEYTVIERLVKWNDITNIVCIYENGEEEYYIIDYKEEDEYLGAPNVYQRHYLSDNGAAYIIISKSGKKVSEYFKIY